MGNSNVHTATVFKDMKIRGHYFLTAPHEFMQVESDVYTLN